VQQLLARSLRRFGASTCLVWEDGAASYAQTHDRVAKLAGWLVEQAGGTRHVAIALPNGRAYIESILACTLGNRVRVPLAHREPIDVLTGKLTESNTEVVICAPELADQLGDWLRESGATALVVGGSGPEFTRFDDVVDGPAAGRLPAGVETDRYRLSFTGGTTGIPKAVVQTHRQERAMIRNLLMETVEPRPGTAYIAATPLAHAAGAFVLPTILRGGAVSWLSGFDPSRVVDSSWLHPGPERWSLETFVVPTALADLTAAVQGEHDLRTVVYGGAPCPAPVLSAAIDRIGLDALVQIYGQAEAPMTICVASRADHANGLVVDGWVGFPFMFTDVSIDAGENVEDAEVGEVVVHGEQIMEGYWNRPEETAERLDPDRGLHTGDVGRLDDAGGLRIVGRAREMMISGGYNVFPDDVERRLRQTGLDDMEFSVFSLPHQRWGEALVVAAVRDASVDEAAQRERVSAAAAGVLAYYERPKEVFFVEALPLTSIGKVSRKDLTATYNHHFDGAEK
jgi:fatty-acyl-CoA synthase